MLCRRLRGGVVARLSPRPAALDVAPTSPAVGMITPKTSRARGKGRCRLIGSGSLSYPGPSSTASGAAGPFCVSRTRGMSQFAEHRCCVPKQFFDLLMGQVFETVSRIEQVNDQVGATMSERVRISIHGSAPSMPDESRARQPASQGRPARAARIRRLPMEEGVAGPCCVM
jgi:hypothetical protein